MGRNMADFLQEGDIIDLSAGMGFVVYADIPEHFAYENRKGSFTIVHNEARIDGQLAYLAGRYVVYKTVKDGGGPGGMGEGVPYPDGHHVFCERLDNQRVKVDFYQSGCFTAMIGRDEIQPVGKAVRRWVAP
jgi:hypothetical protein